MVKKFTTNCDFGAQKTPVTLYVGEPAIGSHPLGFQNKWLSAAKGGAVPSNIMEAFDELRDISEKNRVPFEDLCAYVIEELNSRRSLKEQAEGATALAQPAVKEKPKPVQVKPAQPQPEQSKALPPKTPFFAKTPLPNTPPVAATVPNNITNKDDQK